MDHLRFPCMIQEYALLPVAHAAATPSVQFAVLSNAAFIALANETTAF